MYAAADAATDEAVDHIRENDDESRDQIGRCIQKRLEICE